MFPKYMYSCVHTCIIYQNYVRIYAALCTCLCILCVLEGIHLFLFLGALQWCLCPDAKMYKGLQMMIQPIRYHLNMPQAHAYQKLYVYLCYSWIFTSGACAVMLKYIKVYQRVGIPHSKYFFATWRLQIKQLRDC